MSFDLYPTNPITDPARPWSCSSAEWPAIVEFISRLAPWLVTSETRPRWEHNDFHEVSANDARELASLLSDSFRNGQARRWVDARNHHLASLPDEACLRCEGSGLDPAPIYNPMMNVQEQVVCATCKGSKVRRPDAAYQTADLGLLATLRDWLRGCGGFRIG